MCCVVLFCFVLFFQCFFREETISRLQYEIKCLNEQNKSLIRQYDGSEESLKEYQARNKTLQAKLDE